MAFYYNKFPQRDHIYEMFAVPIDVGCTVYYSCYACIGDSDKLFSKEPYLILPDALFPNLPSYEHYFFLHDIYCASNRRQRIASIGSFRGWVFYSSTDMSGGSL